MYIKMFKIIVSMLLFLKSCVVLLVVIAVINSVDGVPQPAPHEPSMRSKISWETHPSMIIKAKSLKSGFWTSFLIMFV